MSLASLLLALCTPAAHAQADSLVISGLSDQPVRLSLKDIESMGMTEVEDARESTVEGNTQRVSIRYTGIPLATLLEREGLDKVDKHVLRAAVILALAHDGYRVSYSWGELFNTKEGGRVMLITRQDGKPLPPREGVFALRTLGDLRPGPRHVRLLSEIRVVLTPYR